MTEAASHFHNRDTFSQKIGGVRVPKDVKVPVGDFCSLNDDAPCAFHISWAEGCVSAHGEDQCVRRLEPMKEAASTLMNHNEEILNYFMNRLTNAISEGINSMIQAAK